MSNLVLKATQWYCRSFPIRKGKMPLLNLVTKMGFLNGQSTVSTYDSNIKVNLNLEDWIQKQIFFFGQYEVEKKETAFWKELIKPGMVVFDIGANIGYYSLMAGKRVKPNGRVYAFEPVSFTYEKLSLHIAQNELNSNIEANRLALSDKAGELTLYVAGAENTGSSSIFKDSRSSGKEEKVKSLTCDQFVKEKSIQQIDVVKIDVEGSEPFVLRGMAETLINLKPLVLIEVADRRLDGQSKGRSEVYQLLVEAGYEAFNLDNNLQLRKLSEPKEGSLIIFKSVSQNWPPSVQGRVVIN